MPAVIDGSTPDHTGYRRGVAADPAMPVRATVVLRPTDADVAAELLAGRYDPAKHSSPAAADAAVKLVEAFARAKGLHIESSDAAARTILVSGSAEQMSGAFGVTLAWFEAPDGRRYLSYDGAIRLPTEVAPAVLAVLGLDTQPVARPR